ncbi:MAG: hypothetical protein Q8Q52_05170 [Acidimicrobiia bacterium]|nr:hypothetical protein [Acidimicrobiia bacterium]
METPLRPRPSNTFSMADDTGTVTLYHDCRRLLSQAEPSQAIVRIIAEANRVAVENTPHFSVHASVVGDHDRVIVIASNSGGGKSTLAAALLQQGLRYGSDEALCLDDQGLVIAYPKPISLGPWSWEALGLSAEDTFTVEALFTAADLGAELLESGRRPTDLLIPSFTTGAPSLRHLPASTIVTTLLRHSFNHYKDGARAFRLATELAQSMRVWQVDVAHPVETAKLMLETL